MVKRAATPPSSASPTPTVTPTPEVCIGDCGGNQAVTVDELIVMVNVALGSLPASECAAGDRDQDGKIAIDELLLAVNNSLNGCAGTSEQSLVIGTVPGAPAARPLSAPGTAGAGSTMVQRASRRRSQDDAVGDGGAIWRGGFVSSLPLW